MTHVPAASVTTVRVNPVSVCVAVTVTPGSTASLSSVTRPLSSAVACAQAGAPVTRRTNAQTTTRNMRIRNLQTEFSICDFRFENCGLSHSNSQILKSQILTCLRLPPVRRGGRPLRQQPGAVGFGHLAEPRKGL